MYGDVLKLKQLTIIHKKKKCQELTIVDIVTLYEQIPYCDVTFLFLSLMKNRMLSYIYLTLILLL